MDRTAVERWVADYERLWRTPGVEKLAELFGPDVSYRPSPWAPAVEGLAAIEEFWDRERASAAEGFTMASDVVAVDGDTAVVRVWVRYADPQSAQWRDLWVVRFGEDQRCVSFEEWPFAPHQPDGHE
jgi:hypothetical protein